MNEFQERRTWSLGVREVHGWKLKVYGMVTEATSIGETMLANALQHLEKTIPFPGEQGHGFVVLHAGEHAVWLLADLWMDDIVRHFLFRAPLDSPDQFERGPLDGTMACVWELNVVWHERNAWVRHVMSNPNSPNFDGYLSDFLSIDVGSSRVS